MEEIGEQFKSEVFANNPKLYHELWEKPKEDPMDVEFPETEEEFRSMISSMRREGFTG